MIKIIAFFSLVTTALSCSAVVFAGSTTLQAEDYIAASDTTSGNQGGAYRQDNVDIEATTDTGGGFNVGWIATGEWLAYSIVLPTTGSYEVSYRVASLNGGGTLQLEKQGGVLVYGSVNIPSTGGWQKWITIKHIVTLTAGSQNIALAFKSGGFNINSLQIEKVELADGNYRIQNLWLPEQTLNIEQGALSSSVVAATATSGQWLFERITGTHFYRISNRLKPKQSLNIESGKLESSEASSGWWSAQWVLEAVAGTKDQFRLQNRWKSELYINVEGNLLKVSAVQPGWWSAIWKLVPVNTSISSSISSVLSSASSKSSLSSVKSSISSTISSQSSSSSAKSSISSAVSSQSSRSSVNSSLASSSKNSMSSIGIPNPLSPAYQVQSYTLPEPADAAICSGKINATAKLTHFAFAQTHVMEPSWPLFFLVAERPALVEAIVTGAGVAPEIRVLGFIEGKLVGELCLAGPAQLPARVDFSVQQKSDRYTATLPSAWLKPGLSIIVKTGDIQQNFSAEQLKVSAAPDLNLIMLPVDLLNYSKNSDVFQAPKNWLADFAGAVPAARFRFGQLPVRVALPQLVVAPSGVTPFQLKLRPCNNGERSTECVAFNYDRMDIQAAVTRVIDAIHFATGEYSYAYYYGHTGAFNPGGWGGGKHFVGADFTGIFLHEMGHALSLPHWGQGAFQNTTPNQYEYRYPYGGNNNDGGGRGNSWNYYQNIGEFTSPICELKNNSNIGLERSDAMQRNAWCPELRSKDVGPWDGFGDFSAISIFRFMKGADQYAGTVPYRGGNAPFNLPKQTGFPNLLVDSAGKRQLVRANQPMTTINEERYDFLFPQAWDVPVATIYGTYHPSIKDANLIYAPLEYQGTLPRVIDPTDPDTFTRLAERKAYGDFFYWPKDFTIKVTYSDGSKRVALLPRSSIDRNWSMGSGPWRGDIMYYAINVPRNQPIQRVELFERPFVVRGKTDPINGNIANPSLGITPQNYLDGAKLVSTWERP